MKWNDHFMLLLSSVSIAEKMKDFGLGKILVTVHDPEAMIILAMTSRQAFCNMPPRSVA